MPIRKARMADIKAIQALVNDFAKRDQMLPRSLNELYESARDFIVYEEKGSLVGVCALRIMWDDLGEIRSLAVRPQHQKKGIGKKLVKRCLKEAGELGLKRVFALTYHPLFFKKLGFRDIDKAKLPQKIWSDCIKCHKFPECDEHGVILSL
ncbi:MAG: amino-acid N-acetyltransferase [Nitrospirae bacterium]|nr:MAG: amino-acid N-acetyltransferase [Nitrospirota bacterium]